MLQFSQLSFCVVSQMYQHTQQFLVSQRTDYSPNNYITESFSFKHLI